MNCETLFPDDADTLFSFPGDETQGILAGSPARAAQQQGDQQATSAADQQESISVNQLIAYHTNVEAIPGPYANQLKYPTREERPDDGHWCAPPTIQYVMLPKTDVPVYDEIKKQTLSYVADFESFKSENKAVVTCYCEYETSATLKPDSQSGCASVQYTVKEKVPIHQAIYDRATHSIEILTVFVVIRQRHPLKEIADALAQGVNYNVSLRFQHSAFFQLNALGVLIKDEWNRDSNRPVKYFFSCTQSDENDPSTRSFTKLGFYYTDVFPRDIEMVYYFPDLFNERDVFVYEKMQKCLLKMYTAYLKGPQTQA